MPAARGKKALNVSLDESLDSALRALASQPEYGSPSKVVEAAVRQLVEEGISDTGIASIHDHLSTINADVLKTLQDALKAMQSLQQGLDSLERRMARLEQQSVAQTQELVTAYDRLCAQAKPSFWGMVKQYFG